MTQSEKVHARLLLFAVLVAAILVRGPGLIERSIWFDEAHTLLVTAGKATVSWPAEPRPADLLAEEIFGNDASFGKIADDLRRTDVHPPGYFWALSIWRSVFGSSLEAARALSLVCSIGTIVVLFSLLCLAGYARPAIPTVIYALSASAVYFGYEARPYALACLLVMVGALLAYLSAKTKSAKKRTTWSLLAAASLGLAFHVNYLTIFPSGAVLLWLVLADWTTSPKRATGACAVFALLVAAALPILTDQIGSRAHQLAGFVGVGSELQALLFQQFLIIWSPGGIPTRASLFVFVGLVGLVVGSGVVLVREWPGENRSFWLLILGLFLTPSLGVFMLDLILDKHLHYPRYVMLAAPAASVLVGHGLVRLSDRHRWLGIGLLSVLIAILAIPSFKAGEVPLHRYPRGHTSDWIAAVPEDSDVVVAIGAGYGRGEPTAILYELTTRNNGGDVNVLVLEKGDSAERAFRLVRSYRHVWVFRSAHGQTVSEEERVIRLMSEAPSFQRDEVVGRVTHFARRNDAE